MKRVASRANLTVLSETCDIHEDIQLYQKPDGTKICYRCQIEKQDTQLSKELTPDFQELEKKKMKSYLNNKSVLSDKTLLNSGFKNYVTTNEPEAKKNLQSMIEIVKRYQNDEVFNTWLMGSPGVGKSHLAMASLINLNETSEDGRKCLFISVSSMLRKIRAGFNRPKYSESYPYTEDYFIDLMGEVDFLVLDDLGSETGSIGTEKTATDFVHRVLYGVIDLRQGKPTIFTTNLSWEELEAMYDSKILSRMKQGLEVISFTETTDKRIGY